MFENAIHITGNSQGSVGAASQVYLGAGVYDVWSAADTYIKVNKISSLDVSSSNGYLLRAGNTVPLILKEPAYLGSTGTLYYHKVG